MSIKSKIICGLLLIASLSLFIVTIKQPQFAEGVGGAWGVLFNAAEVVE